VIESALGRLAFGVIIGAGLIALGLYEIRTGESWSEGGVADRKGAPFLFWMGAGSAIAAGLFAIGYGLWWYWF
jgi:hypothetical protein